MSDFEQLNPWVNAKDPYPISPVRDAEGTYALVARGALFDTGILYVERDRRGRLARLATQVDDDIVLVRTGVVEEIVTKIRKAQTSLGLS